MKQLELNREKVSVALNILRARQYQPSFKSGLLGASLIGFTDHAMISAINFVAMVMIARSMPIESFGHFTFLYTFFLFANGLQAALITQPHNTLGPMLRGKPYIRYTSTAALAQLVLSGIIVIITMTGLLVGELLHWGEKEILGYLGLATVLWQAQEFVRRVLFTEGRLLGVLVNDGISYGSFLILVAYLWQQSLLTPSTAFLSLSISSLVGVALGAWAVRGSIFSMPDLNSFREHWNLGKWLTGAVIAWSSYTTLWHILVASVTGPGSLGLIRATQNLIAPTQILGSAFASICGPRASSEYLKGGHHRLASFLWRASVAVLAIMAVYCLGLVQFSDKLIRLLYSDDYVSGKSIVILLSISYLLMQITTTLTLWLRTLKITRSLFYGSTLGSITGLLIAFPLMERFGTNGAILSLVISQIAVVAVLVLPILRNSVSITTSNDHGLD